VTINENGSRRIITKREALAKQVANKGATGDLKSIKLLFEILEGLDDRERFTRSETQKSTASERVRKKLDRLHERIAARQAEVIKESESR
jgi:hypothetical protein